MLSNISQAIRQQLQFPEHDQLILDGKLFPIDKNKFNPILATTNFSANTSTFIDGGQAEILSAGNFCLSFIRIVAQTFSGRTKKGYQKQEFYLFTKAIWKNEEIFYESTFFPLDNQPLIAGGDLFISSMDLSIKTGIERAPITRIANMARRLAELHLAAQINTDFTILDGTLEATFSGEEHYLARIKETACALAKTSALFTTSGNNPTVLLRKLSPSGCWQYDVDNKTSFVKLHPQAKHIFRFQRNSEGDNRILALLAAQSDDALFLGYPYGLILADQLARVSNAERQALRMNFLLRKENREVVEYLNATNAHDILDNLG